MYLSVAILGLCPFGCTQRLCKDDKMPYENKQTVDMPVPAARHAKPKRLSNNSEGRGRV